MISGGAGFSLWFWLGRNSSGLSQTHQPQPAQESHPVLPFAEGDS